MTATSLVPDYFLIAMEDLMVLNLVHSAKGTLDNLGRNSGHYLQTTCRTMQPLSFPAHLKAAIPASTSRTCSSCGDTKAHDHKSKAVAACSTCGYSAKVDINAACKISAVGLGSLREVTGRRATPHAHVHGSLEQVDPSKKKWHEPQVFENPRGYPWRRCEATAEPVR